MWEHSEKEVWQKTVEAKTKTYFSSCLKPMVSLMKTGNAMEGVERSEVGFRLINILFYNLGSWWQEFGVIAG